QRSCGRRDFKASIDGDAVPLEPILMVCLSRPRLPLTRDEKVFKFSLVLCMFSPLLTARLQVRLSSGEPDFFATSPLILPVDGSEGRTAQIGPYPAEVPLSKRDRRSRVPRTTRKRLKGST